MRAAPVRLTDHSTSPTFDCAANQFANERYIETFPTVKFIGHAIDWWGAIDRNYSLEKGNYPRGRVTPRGLTDQWLTRYPNLYCDLSATSGDTSLLRDPDFAKDFVIRHQNKIMFGTDCSCSSVRSPRAGR
jgi:hypothetical protein